MKSRIYYTKPSITELEVQYATDAAANGWGEKCYDYIKRFEEAFKDHLCVEYAIATSSCTGALHMGMSALGIGSGDEGVHGAAQSPGQAQRACLDAAEEGRAGRGKHS